MIKNKEFNKKVKDLIDRGSRVYVGTDSMIRGDKCIFATVIAFHNNEKNIAKYYYKKFNLECPDYRNLKIKITEDMIGHKLGEFIPTRVKFFYKQTKNK